VFAVAGNGAVISRFLLRLLQFLSSVGVYMSGPVLGRIVDSKGPRPLLIAAFIFLLSGYSGIRGIFDAGLGKGEELSRLRFVLIVLCSFLSGVGGHAGMASAMNTTAKNFPDKLVSPTTPNTPPQCI
jgi:MFS family permease